MNFPELNATTLHTAIDWLIQQDADLGRIVTNYGRPPLFLRPPGYATLILLILEQQVSLASARAAYTRLEAALGEITPARFLTLDDAALRGIGFSRQKTRYGRLLSEAVLDGTIDLASLSEKDDAAVQAELIQLKGIGSWTANIYLMTALRRTDIWPVKDRALVVATRQVKRLAQDPSPEALLQIGESWRPYRSIATHLLWHFYLSR